MIYFCNVLKCVDFQFNILLQFFLKSTSYNFFLLCVITFSCRTENKSIKEKNEYYEGRVIQKNLSKPKVKNTGNKLKTISQNKVKKNSKKYNITSIKKDKLKKSKKTSKNKNIEKKLISKDTTLQVNAKRKLYIKSRDKENMKSLTLKNKEIKISKKKYSVKEAKSILKKIKKKIKNILQKRDKKHALLEKEKLKKELKELSLIAPTNIIPAIGLLLVLLGIIFALIPAISIIVEAILGIIGLSLVIGHIFFGISFITKKIMKIKKLLKNRGYIKNYSDTDTEFSDIEEWAISPKD